MSAIENIKNELMAKSKKDKAEFLPNFFKTGPGEYGEGDVFIGTMVPDIRKISRENRGINLKEILALLKSRIHEERLCALLILVEKFNKAEGKERDKIFNFYIKNTEYINNWDLVDLSAPKIVGAYLLYKSKTVLYKFARSKNLWEKRIAIISTYYFIQNNLLEDTIKISKILLEDSHDLIHKAVGWMLRELGKKNQKLEEEFLKKHVKKIPRTTLRYAIERFSEVKRKYYMKK